MNMRTSLASRSENSGLGEMFLISLFKLNFSQSIVLQPLSSGTRTGTAKEINHFRLSRFDDEY